MIMQFSHAFSPCKDFLVLRGEKVSKFLPDGRPWIITCFLTFTRFLLLFLVSIFGRSSKRTDLVLVVMINFEFISASSLSAISSVRPVLEVPFASTLGGLSFVLSS